MIKTMEALKLVKNNKMPGGYLKEFEFNYKDYGSMNGPRYVKFFVHKINDKFIFGSFESEVFSIPEQMIPHLDELKTHLT